MYVVHGPMSGKIRISQFAYFWTKLALAENWGAAKQNKIGFPTPQTSYIMVTQINPDESYFEKWLFRGSDRQPEIGKNLNKTDEFILRNNETDTD